MIHKTYLGIVSYLQSKRLLIIVLTGLFLLIDLSCTQYTKAENEEYPFDFGYGPYRRKIIVPISKGSLRVSGNFNYQAPFGTGVDYYAHSLLISPAIVYFATNGLAPGFDASYQYAYAKNESYSTDIHEFTIMPKVYYFKTLTNNIYPYLAAGIGISKSYYRSTYFNEQFDSSSYAMPYNLGAGITFMISSNKSISIETGCLTSTPAAFEYNVFYTKIGFDFFIPLRKTVILE